MEEKAQRVENALTRIFSNLMFTTDLDQNNNDASTFNIETPSCLANYFKVTTLNLSSDSRLLTFFDMKPNTMSTIKLPSSLLLCSSANQNCTQPKTILLKVISNYLQQT